MNRNAPIGLVAVETEAGCLRAALGPPVAEPVGWVRLYPGRIHGRDVVLAETLVGQVAGAMAAQALVQQYDVGCLVVCGSAGALAPRLDVGHAVIARRVVAHDAGHFVGDHFLPTGSMVRDARGRRARRRALEADAGLVAAAHAAARALYGGSHVWLGTLASGSQAIFAPGRRDWLYQTFGALAVDMESAAVALVAEAFGRPWVAVRSVSDRASPTVPVDLRPLLRYTDDSWPVWRRRLGRWGVLLQRPALWREVRRLQRGLQMAADRAAQVVLSMVPQL